MVHRAPMLSEQLLKDPITDKLGTLKSEGRLMQDFVHFLNLHPQLSIAALVIIFLIFFVEFLRLKRDVIRVDTAKAIHLINRENAVVFDIRAPENFQAGHIADAHIFKPDELKSSNKKIEKFRGKPIIVVCDSGVTSQKIANELIAAGFQAYSLSGGMRAWNAAGILTVKG